MLKALAKLLLSRNYNIIVKRKSIKKVNKKKISTAFFKDIGNNNIFIGAPARI